MVPQHKGTQLYNLIRLRYLISKMYVAGDCVHTLMKCLVLKIYGDSHRKNDPHNECTFSNFSFLFQDIER